MEAIPELSPFNFIQQLMDNIFNATAQGHIAPHIHVSPTHTTAHDHFGQHFINTKGRMC